VAALNVSGRIGLQPGCYCIVFGHEAPEDYRCSFEWGQSLAQMSRR
jgi:hypothetical protein